MIEAILVAALGDYGGNDADYRWELVHCPTCGRIIGNEADNQPICIICEANKEVKNG